jgi:tripartite-type tricarboxylate transporter receptor subunit TctC
MAPAATPMSIIRRLHQETTKVLALPNLRRKFDELDMQPIGNSPEEFASAIQTEIPHWAKVVQGSRMKLAE